ncbi:MAG: mechanosensitive ion channel family protein [Candidatus Krumholzibacteria bacterium]|nr:mechanosensitive ion channel family protein [Candidatus Krumholzibacteria bacterium]
MNGFNLSEWLQKTVGLLSDSQGAVAYTVIIVLVLWLARRLLLRAVERRLADAHAHYHWRKTTAYLAFFIAFIFVVRIWFKGFQQLSTVVGLVSAGIAIALKDPLVNLAGWVFIAWRRPFEVGDRIEVGRGVAGDVIDLRIFAFTLMEIGNWVHADQSTGRVVHVPNGRVFTEAVANYSKGFKYIWDEIGVLVTFESNWREAKSILDGIVKRHAEHLSGEAEKRVREVSRRFMIFYTKLTPIVYTSVEDSGVTLTMRYLTEPQSRRARAQAIWEDVLTAFAERDDIDFAYPTTRYYDNTQEGKSGAVKSAGPGAPPPDPGHFA